VDRLIAYFAVMSPGDIITGVTSGVEPARAALGFPVRLCFRGLDRQGFEFGRVGVG
jgi:hypothetical protein